jgi:HEAT repeat protein
MRKPATIGLFIVFAVGVLVVLTRLSEPRYHARSLTSWLEQCANTPLMEAERLAEAQESVRAIGAPKALPRLLALIKATDNRFSVWLTAKSEKFGIEFLRRPSALELQLQGIAGFEALGTNGAPAVGELTRLLNDNQFAFVAVRCLEHIGKSAEPPLSQCLTNQDWQVRHYSVLALASATDDIEVYFARIKDRLKDVEPSVRFATVQAVGRQSHAPELAVPLLIPALEDPEDSVCGQAALALSGFGTNAVSAFPPLTNLVNTGRRAQVRAALKALVAIAPGEALPVLSNAVVNGSPDTSGAALKTLKTIAPETAVHLSRQRHGR